MVETDWRKILNFTNKELNDADKETLCESLSWMEADDIELNFSDLKTLFRLAQDILKHKSEQVNNLLGKVETLQKKAKKRSKSSAEVIGSPAPSSDDVLETIAHQEELIKGNKDILEQLYTDIADLEAKKKGYHNTESTDKDSESSRDPLSEINAINQLEKDVAMKNKHIRKLLLDVKMLEDENVQFKEKISTLNEKLTEATQIIENLTEQLFGLNNECSKLKDSLGKSEESKSKLLMKIKLMETKTNQKQLDGHKSYESIREKVQHWKNFAKFKKTENENLTAENNQLKDELYRITQNISSPEVQSSPFEIHNKEIQSKLIEASNDIFKSANIIEQLKKENKRLKEISKAAPDESVMEVKNESDENKQLILVNNLKRKIAELNMDLKKCEEILMNKEKELADATAELQLLKSGDKGFAKSLKELKLIKRQTQLQEEEIKTFVKEINELNKTIDDLQLQNEYMRQKFGVADKTNIPVKGIIKKMHENEQQVNLMSKEIQRMENKLVTLEIEKRNSNSIILKMKEKLYSVGYDINDIIEQSDDDEAMPTHGEGDGPRFVTKNRVAETQKEKNAIEKALIEENEGLRRGLQEILDFLKDNSTTSSGILSLECPALESVLQSMEARHTAGWIAPHMRTILELKAAIGGRDTLLKALHESKKENYDVMRQLSIESKKCQELEQKLFETENKTKTVEDSVRESGVFSDGEFGTWMSDRELGEIDYCDKSQIDEIICKGNLTYENQLRNGLIYFHTKFKTLYDKMTTISVQAADEQNNLLIENERLKAEIENMKCELNQKNDVDDASDDSPGLLSNSESSTGLQRKCDYLSEAYRHIRTANENIRNELLECRRENLIATAKYETQVQKLILSIANLTDKLRNSISVDFFYKQNELLNDLITKHRILAQENIKIEMSSKNLEELLHKDKIDIISQFQNTHSLDKTSANKNMLKNVEIDVLQKQIESLCKEINEKNSLITEMETKNIAMQESQSNLIDKTLSSITHEEYDLIKTELDKISKENIRLNEQFQNVTKQLNIAVLQVHDHQQRQMSSDMEINMLKHQILDLQSSSDNKAIIARLSSEILLVHIQANESHCKIEKLNSDLQRERQKTLDTEELLNAREKIFNVYLQRCESKYRYLYEVVETLRYQYQGSLPLNSVEEYLKNIMDLSRKNVAVDAKLNEIEDIQSKLLSKSIVLEEIIDECKDKCFDDEDNCPHKIKYIIMQNMNTREKNHLMKKVQTLEKSRTDLVNQCSILEKTLVMVNRGFENAPLFEQPFKKSDSDSDFIPNLELEDVLSEDESVSRKSQTITLPRPLILKAPNNIDMTKQDKNYMDVLPGSPAKTQPTVNENQLATANVFVQTNRVASHVFDKPVQTEKDTKSYDLEQTLEKVRGDHHRKMEENKNLSLVLKQKTQELSLISTENNLLKQQVVLLNEHLDRKNTKIMSSEISIRNLEQDIAKANHIQRQIDLKSKDRNSQDSSSLIQALKKVENDKNQIVEEYKTLLANERKDYVKAVNELNNKIKELESRPLSQIDESKPNQNHEIVRKYTLKIVELEDQCFKLQSEMDNYKTELKTYQNEAERWKELAAERLSKMELLNSQLEVRHCTEVDSYKAENQHWLSQLNDAQRDHVELRHKLSEQKAVHVKQLADKDTHIEQLRTIVHNLKTQIMSMQTLMSVNDPSFDLSAIVEVETDSEGAVSQRGDPLEIKFDSSTNLQDDPVVKLASSSTSIWQEPIIDRLRREKLLTGKQNSILRRQIKILAARERRARLETQNLKNQIYRISTSGHKLSSAESLSLQAKISSLTSQLHNAKRDSQSSVALWDKWKRAQQAAERWQVRFEEKCREIKKNEISLNLAKSSIARLEKEKRVLLMKLTECEERQLPIEKQEHERPEKLKRDDYSDYEIKIHVPPHISTQSLMDRIEAQQRRIAALELADKGNEPLVTEYEKVLAENTVLKGQVLKLESTLLEFQIRTPMKTKQDNEPELEYWKNYCEMLKEENLQLSLKIRSLDVTPCSGSQQRINDLEQTILTLRGLVSKLQAEQKSSGSQKRVESKLNTSWNSDKTRNQLETCRIEIGNLKRTIIDKDNLLERSKEMLKIAAEREDELLRENAMLLRRFRELSKSSGGSNSA